MTPGFEYTGPVLATVRSSVDAEVIPKRWARMLPTTSAQAEQLQARGSFSSAASEASVRGSGFRGGLVGMCVALPGDWCIRPSVKILSSRIQ